MQIGIDSFVETVVGSAESAGVQGAQRVDELLEEIVLADRVGLDVYGIGEHHREEYIASSPAVLLAAAAVRTQHIRLSSAVTVLSSDDPVRVFQDFATVDLLSHGRAEIIAGRGSFIESYPLFGYDMDLYDELFSEKLDLLLKLREQTRVEWKGKHRASLTGQGVWPRPLQKVLPVRLGVGGTPQSFVRAGTLGLPLTVAIIGGEPHRFRPLVDLYREAGRRAGHLGRHARCGRACDRLSWPTPRSRQPTFSGRRTPPPLAASAGNAVGVPTTRAAFDAQRGPTGAFFVGDPETVARKMWHVSDALGGVSRISFMMSGGPLPHTQLLRSIELMGTAVRPLVNRSAVQEERPVTA